MCSYNFRILLVSSDEYRMLSSNTMICSSANVPKNNSFPLSEPIGTSSLEYTARRDKLQPHGDETWEECLAKAGACAASDSIAVVGSFGNDPREVPHLSVRANKRSQPMLFYAPERHVELQRLSLYNAESGT